MVVPVNKVVRVQVIGADVIHAFAVPSFGIKIDADPGPAERDLVQGDAEGVYYGQCSELCGKDHAFMPIAVRVVSEQAYAAWVAEAEEEVRDDDRAPDDAIVAAAGKVAGANAAERRATPIAGGNGHVEGS